MTSLGEIQEACRGKERAVLVNEIAVQTARAEDTEAFLRDAESRIQEREREIVRFRKQMAILEEALDRLQQDIESTRIKTLAVPADVDPYDLYEPLARTSE